MVDCGIAFRYFSAERPLFNSPLKYKQLSYSAWAARLPGLLLLSIALFSLNVMLRYKGRGHPAPRIYSDDWTGRQQAAHGSFFPPAFSLGEVMIARDTVSKDEEKMLRGAARGKITIPAHRVSIFVPANRYYLNPKIGDTLPPRRF